jgi:hypothetical protein
VIFCDSKLLIIWNLRLWFLRKILFHNILNIVVKLELRQVQIVLRQDLDGPSLGNVDAFLMKINLSLGFILLEFNEIIEYFCLRSCIVNFEDETKPLLINSTHLINNYINDTKLNEKNSLCQLPPRHFQWLSRQCFNGMVIQEAQD